MVSYGLLLAAGLAGAAVVVRRRRWPASLGLLLGSAVLVCVVFFPQERFRIPVIDPALIVLAPRAGSRSCSSQKRIQMS